MGLFNDNDFQIQTGAQATGLRIMPPPERKYWRDALYSEIEATWGKHPAFGTDAELEDLCYYATLTTFYDETPADVRMRRNLLYYYLAGPFSTSKIDNPLRVNAHKLPIDSFVPKVLDALCHGAYGDPPARKLAKQGKVDDEGTLRMQALYKEMEADARFGDVYRLAKLCGGVAVRPYVDSNGDWRIMALPPDMFRYLLNPGDSQKPGDDTIVKFVVPSRKVVGSSLETVFDVWTKEEHWQENYKGEVTGQKEPNPYGRIPYVVLRLREPSNSDLFGGGLFSLIEAVLASNAIRFTEDNSVLMEAFGHWVAVNMGLSKTDEVQFGFGRITALDGVLGPQDGGGIPPQLDHASSNGQYTQIFQLRVDRAKHDMRLQGLPDYIVSEQGGNPPSGQALFIENKPLREARKKDEPALRGFENRFYGLYAVVYNVDAKGSSGFKPLPTDSQLSADYAEEAIVEDPAERMQVNVRRLLMGILSPSKFAQIEMGVDGGISDADAVELIQVNQVLMAPIRDILGAIGGAPLTKDIGVQAPTEIVNPNPTPATEAVKIDPNAP